MNHLHVHAHGGGGAAVVVLPKGRSWQTLALQTLARHRMPTDGLRSKGWDGFALAGVPAPDFVVTVCDQAAGATCALWPGQPTTAHWGMPDPAAVHGSDDERSLAFLDAFVTLKRRIQPMLALPLPSLDALAVRREVRNIGTR